MEEEVKSKGPSLMWAEYGPDLSVFAESDRRVLNRLVRKYGELAVRYAAHLTAKMVPYDSNDDWLWVIRHAVEQGWMSAYCMQRMAERFHAHTRSYALDSVTIPWLKLIIPDVGKKGRTAIEAACAYEQTTWAELTADHVNARSSRLLDCYQLRAKLHPDLRFVNVFRWLCFVVEGSEDPQLCDAHASLHVEGFKEYPRYERAWRELDVRPDPRPRPSSQLN